MFFVCMFLFFVTLGSPVCWSHLSPLIFCKSNLNLHCKCNSSNFIFNVFVKFARGILVFCFLIQNMPQIEVSSVNNSWNNMSQTEIQSVDPFWGEKTLGVKHYNQKLKSHGQLGIWSDRVEQLVRKILQHIKYK